MLTGMAGEWGEYEIWQLSAMLFDLQNQVNSLQREISRREKIEKKYYRRDERKQQIRGILASGKIFTTSQIAKSLGMSSSGYLRDILCELYQRGEIAGYAQGTVASHPIYYWYEQRTIPVPFPDLQDTAICEDQIGCDEGVFEAEG